MRSTRGLRRSGRDGIDVDPGELGPGSAFCFRASWSSIDGTVVAAHIHPAPVGVPGPVAIPLFSGTFAGTDSTSGCVSANGLAAAIIANPSGYYVNIHTTVSPPGAVRAQLG